MRGRALPDGSSELEGRATSPMTNPKGGSELGSSVTLSFFGAARWGDGLALMSSWISRRADGSSEGPSGLAGGSDACQQVRRASTYSPPSLTRPSGRRCGEGVYGKVPGLGRSLVGCFGGLRMAEASSERDDGSYEGRLASVGDGSCPSGRGAESFAAGWHSRRRDVVSRWFALVLFGAPELAGSSRLNSSEFGLL